MKISFFKKPFEHMIIDDFMDEKEYKEIFKEIMKLDYTRKESDLFSLSQTKDLTNSDLKGIKIFKAKMMKYAPLLETNFKVKLKSVDMSSMRYKSGDYLLCHDDQLEGRAIAYILYLNTLSSSEGGELSLIETKKPYNKIKIQPKINRLVLFKVSQKSWHEVEELKQQKKKE